MPIGTSKVGALGGLVPGGTETFNAPGTFSIPPGVKNVSITGVGGTGNPGNPGNAGNAGGIGGSGGGGGGGKSGFAQNSASPFPPACIPDPLLFRVTGAPGGQGGPTNLTNISPGPAGSAGATGNAGNAGTAGNGGAASSGLGQNFSGGAGGNAGNAGVGGAGGAGGAGGNQGANSSNNITPWVGPSGLGSPPVSGGNPGGGASTSNFPAPLPNNPGVGGGGGAGETNAGGIGGQSAYFPSGNQCVQAFGGSRGNPGGGIGGRALLVSDGLFGAGGSYPCGPAYGTPFGNIYNDARPPVNFSNTAVNATALSTPWGPCAWNLHPTAPRINSPKIRTYGQPGSVQYINSPGSPNFMFGEPALCQGATDSIRRGMASTANRAGGGGGAGASGNTPGGRFRTVGGGGGGRGAVGNCGSPAPAAPSGGNGQAGTPSTVNCVTVTPGATVPITVGSPGGQIVISWNPQ